MGDTILKTDGLTVFYGKHRGILNVNLDVTQGEVFGFLGPNGAGKTTTLRVLLDLIRPNRGSASIFGLNCQRQGVQIRKRIGYIPGELALPGNMRGRAYLNMLDAVRSGSMSTEYRRLLSARFDLDISRRIRDYSRGNKQKLALVAAFMHKPDLLILDEPTGGLDPLVQQAVLETVKEAKADGRTVFFSSHILPEVQEVADRVAIIRNGEIVTTQRIDELLARRSHRLRLRVAEELPSALLSADGVRVLRQSDTEYEVDISRNLESFMRGAATHGILDIETQSLTLEEAFLAYYG